MVAVLQFGQVSLLSRAFESTAGFLFGKFLKISKEKFIDSSRIN